MEYKPKNIYCPKCSRKVAIHDGKRTIDIKVKCKKCIKLVVYKPDTDTTELKEVPERTTSSGMRFY